MIKESIKKEPIWIGVKKTILLIWTSHFELVLYDSGGLLTDRLLDYLSGHFENWIVDHLISPVSTQFFLDCYQK